MDDSSDGKKSRLEPAPSRVLHIRGLPADISEQELLPLMGTLGTVANTLVLRGKGQAFVEMRDLAVAKHIVSYFPTLSVRGYTARFQYSAHQELKVEPQAAASPAEPSAVLHVQVANLVYPVTLETIHSLFSRHGQVHKIITYAKAGGFRALVQMSDSQTASMAKSALDNQHIYTGCCMLQITFSTLKELIVRYNNDRSWDYTNPSLSAGGPAGPYGGPGGPSSMAPPHPRGPGMHPHGGPQMAGGPPMSMQHPHGPPMGMGHAMAAGPAIMPGPHGGGPMPGPYGPAMGPGFGGPPPFPGGPQPFMPGMGPGPASPVILVSNIVPDTTTCDHLFVLFGVYGDVLRIKIPYRKKSTALIQFREPSMAQQAVSYLNDIPLHGSVLHVQMSKFGSVSLPRAEEGESGLTKDYTNSPLHRFKNAVSKNRTHIYPVSSNLHLSSLPETMPDEEIARAFMSFGVVTNVRRFPADARMAVIEFAAVDQAINALVNMHNAALGTSPHIRISFAKG